MMDGVQESGDVDFYKLLQIPSSAKQMDIINAYRHAKLAYQEGSLAIYSLFSEQELESIREQVEQAYQTLSDSERRHQYDLTHGYADEASVESVSAENVIPLHQSSVENSEIPEKVDRNDIPADYCGAFLRRAREAKGVSLESIAGHTKISKHYLQAIEDEDSTHFPELVYLKGYLRQYCSEIGLEPDPVVAQYISLMESKKGLK